MKSSAIDGLFVTGEENFQYFVGNSGKLSTQPSALARPAILFLPREGEPIAVVHALAAEILRRHSVIRNVKPYSEVLGIPNALLVEAVEESRLRGKTLGAEFGLEQRIDMPYNDFFKFIKSVPDTRFVDGTSILTEMRMVKSKEEVALMVRAADITGRARQECFSQIDKGMTEREIARLFSELMLREGADRVSFVNISVGQPVRSTVFPVEVPLEEGQALNLDGGAYFRTHTIDFPRIATVGKSSERQIANHKMVVSVSYEMARGIRPGVKCSDIWKIGAGALSKYGLPPNPAGRMGHGQGMRSTEPPSISATDGTVLDPGMVLSAEPSVINESGDFTFENTFVVTQDGFRQLTNEPDELREIDFSK